MSIMTEEEMDYQIELNEFYSNKNDSVENLYEFTESELSEHDSEVQADTIRKFAEWLINNMFNGRNEFWKNGTPNNKPLRMEDFIAEYEGERNNG